MRQLRITRTEADRLRTFTKEAKKRLDSRQASIIAFAKMFGKFLPDYNRIIVGA